MHIYSEVEILTRVKFGSNNVVTFTLWNDQADNFEEDKYLEMKQPIVLAVSSCYLKIYGGKHKFTSYTKSPAFLRLIVFTFLFTLHRSATIICHLRNIILFQPAN